MGGSGSGRYERDGRADTTNDRLALDVRSLQRSGRLSFGQTYSVQWACSAEYYAAIQVQSEGDHLILRYRILGADGEWQPLEYAVRLEWTDCHFGGQRAWFRCPVQGCGRRVAILLYGGTVFACRHCQRLVYASQRETAQDRMRRRVDAIRLRLGWPPGIWNGEGDKPKGMHWSTFERLKAEHDFFAQQRLIGLAVRVGLLSRRLASHTSR